MIYIYHNFVSACSFLWAGYPVELDNTIKCGTRSHFWLMKHVTVRYSDIEIYMGRCSIGIVSPRALTLVVEDISCMKKISKVMIWMFPGLRRSYCGSLLWILYGSFFIIILILFQLIMCSVNDKNFAFCMVYGILDSKIMKCFKKFN